MLMQQQSVPGSTEERHQWLVDEQSHQSQGGES